MEKNLSHFDWQGHRGCRGLMPENTIEAFIHALTFKQVKTLEMDVCVSKDGKIFVSHEPWMNFEIATKPNGEEVTEAECMQLNTYKMNYDEIKSYDCGFKIHPRFVHQKKQKAYKPLLSEVVENVNNHCKNKNHPKPNYNIEIKSDERVYDIYQPQPAIFVKKVLEETIKLGIKNNTTFQSFDVKCLKELRKLDTNLTLALLVENEDGLEKNLQCLGFIPNIYSCYYKQLTKEIVELCHKKQMKVIPWTVNSAEEMQQLIEIGVDGIITDYPNLIK